MSVPYEIDNLFNPAAFGTVFAAPSAGSYNPGKGTASDPYRITDDVGFDNLLRKVAKDRTPRLHLYPGTYLTRGPWAFPEHGYTTLPNPLTLSGDGEEHTVIKLSPDAIFETNGVVRPDNRALTLGCLYTNNGKFRVANLCIDGNEQAFSPNQVVTNGLFIVGNAPEVRNVSVCNIRGSEAEHYESFAILLNNHKNDGDHRGPDGGGVIDQCTVYNDGTRNNYFSGVYPGYVNYGRGVMTTTVSRCKSISTSGLSRLPFSLQCKTNFRDCYSRGFRYAFYNDTGSVEDCMIDGCVAEDLSYIGLCLIATASDTPWLRRNVSVVNSVFRYRPVPRQEWIGVNIIDQMGQAPTDNICLMNNVFELAEGASATRRFCSSSVLSRLAKNVRLVMNTFPENALQHTAAPTSASAVTYISNRYSAGTNAYSLPELSSVTQ